MAFSVSHMAVIVLPSPSFTSGMQHGGNEMQQNSKTHTQNSCMSINNRDKGNNTPEYKAHNS